MKIGTVKSALSVWELTGTSLGTYPAGLDDAIAATLSAPGSFAFVGSSSSPAASRP